MLLSKWQSTYQNKIIQFSRSSKDKIIMKLLDDIDGSTFSEEGYYKNSNNEIFFDINLTLFYRYIPKSFRNSMLTDWWCNRKRRQIVKLIGDLLHYTKL